MCHTVSGDLSHLLRLIRHTPAHEGNERVKWSTYSLLFPRQKILNRQYLVLTFSQPQVRLELRVLDGRKHADLLNRRAVQSRQ
jgi:hypothetical protein